MNSIDLTPFYRNDIGFEHFAPLFNGAFHMNKSSGANPAYNIEALDENHYAITLLAAGFDDAELEIQVENDVLTVSGKKADTEGRKYLYRGIPQTSFEQKFSLADYIEVRDASLKNGLLTIHLEKEMPEAMKPRRIQINAQQDNTSAKVFEHQPDEKQDRAMEDDKAVRLSS